MRRDREGNIHTLEEDIEKIWLLHGWKIEKEVTSTEDGIDVWKIYGKWARPFKNEVEKND